MILLHFFLRFLDERMSTSLLESSCGPNPAIRSTKMVVIAYAMKYPTGFDGLISSTDFDACRRLIAIDVSCARQIASLTAITPAVDQFAQRIGRRWPEPLFHARKALAHRHTSPSYSRRKVCSISLPALSLESVYSHYSSSYYYFNSVSLGVESCARQVHCHNNNIIILSSFSCIIKMIVVRVADATTKHQQAAGYEQQRIILIVVIIIITNNQNFHIRT